MVTGDPFSPLAFAATLPIGELQREILGRRARGSETTLQLPGRFGTGGADGCGKGDKGNCGRKTKPGRTPLHHVKMQVLHTHQEPSKGMKDWWTKQRDTTDSSWLATLRGERRNGIRLRRNGSRVTSSHSWQRSLSAVKTRLWSNWNRHKSCSQKKDKWNSRQYRQRMSCYTTVWPSEQHTSSGFFSQKSRSEERKPST